MICTYFFLFCCLSFHFLTFILWSISSVQLLSHVQLFVTPWTAAHQASLSITNSWSLLRLTSIELVMPSNHLILCRPLHFLPSIFGEATLIYFFFCCFFFWCHIWKSLASSWSWRFPPVFSSKGFVVLAPIC